MNPYDQGVGTPDQCHETCSPSVSVIIPAFNAESTLGEALESALAQTLQDIEVIVIDDGSTDGTREIAQSFAARDSRVRVISQPNAGLAGARNAGINAARAPFVSPLDADDVWHPSFLEKVCAALKAGADDTLFAFAYSRSLNERGVVLGSTVLESIDGYAFNRFVYKNFVGNGSGMMFRRSAALAVGGYDRRLQYEFDSVGCEDFLLEMQLAARGHVASVCEYLVGYRKHRNAMSSNRVRMVRSREYAYRILFDEMGCRDTLAARWALGRTFADRFWPELKAGNVPVALRVFVRAWLLDGRGTLDRFWQILQKRLKSVLSALRLTALPRGNQSQRMFTDFAPLEGARTPEPDLEMQRIERMAEEDRKEAERRVLIPKGQSDTSTDMMDS